MCHGSIPLSPVWVCTLSGILCAGLSLSLSFAVGYRLEELHTCVQCCQWTPGDSTPVEDLKQYACSVYVFSLNTLQITKKAQQWLHFLRSPEACQPQFSATFMKVQSRASFPHQSKCGVIIALPRTGRHSSLKSRTKRPTSSFYPQAIRLADSFLTRPPHRW